MNLAELTQLFRLAANDQIEPYFWSDEAVAEWFNEAQDEAAIRGRLIHESDSALICAIKVKPGQATYKLHPSLYEIDYIALEREGLTNRQPLKLVSGERLNEVMPQWREREGDPEYAIQGDKGIRLVPRPLDAGTVRLEGYRLPTSAMDSDSDEPELNSTHHRHLVQWALFKAFSVPDAEIFDPQRAGEAEDAFTGYFGSRPDSDLRRLTREDVQHHVTAFWP